ncbi:hypothetical protein VSU16_03550 [Cetobacterium somerae]|uniref:hypothetical protein n=1 Tax=Cetobacterium somerae TaxID=188913 RepID=UPI002E7B9FBE|nr:hypothetical protein [Cetobacterium somerae]WVJ01817.1 hypothetical protein VSU16_03550 [Cetobacterium somerae]
MVADSYVSTDDVFLHIYKNRDEVAKQRTSTTGCVSCNVVIYCTFGDEIKVQSTAPGYEFNYSIIRINDYN